MFITPSFKKSLIVEQFQGNYLNRMEDQTNFLLAQAGEDKAANARIENGECCVVSTSPESLLGNGRWSSRARPQAIRKQKTHTESLFAGYIGEGVCCCRTFTRKNLIDIVVDETHCVSLW